jgi:predicted RNA-binding protein YlqC (UPF0109 family)
MKELIETIAKALVENSGEVAIQVVEKEQTTVLQLRVASSDLGRIIGKKGRTAESIRTLMRAIEVKLKRKFILEIEE